MDCKHIAVICAVLGILAFAIFIPVGRFGYVDYDDIQYIRDNPNVAKGLSVAGLQWAFTSTQPNYWQPLTWISHMTDCHLFGLSPQPHHIVNLLFHVANTILLFLLLQHATGFVGRSAWVAALFAVHPLHVESVAWLAERKGLLSTFFCLLSMLAYVRYTKTNSWKHYVLTALCFLLACMAKPIVVTLPLLLLLLDLWPLSRLNRAKTWRIIVEKIPLLGISALISIITIWASHRAGGYLTLDKLPLGFRLSKVPISYTQYLAKTLWPKDLTILYPLPDQWDMSKVLLASMLMVAITGFVVIQRRRRSYLAAGWFWFLVCLLPGLGLVAAGSQQVISDRFAYMAVMGIFIMLVWGVLDLYSLRATQSSSMLPMNLLAGASVAACAWLSVIQLPVWRNADALWSHAIQVTQKSPVRNAEMLADIGQALVNHGQPAAASNYFAEALSMKPDFPRAHAHYARALLALTNYAETIRQGQLALSAQPKDFVTQHVVGKAYLAMGDIDAALSHLSNSLHLYPQFFEDHGHLAIALAARGRLDEATAFLQEGIRIDPRSVHAHFHLGSVLEAKKDFQGAVEQYREALRFQPNSFAALNNLAWILATNPSASLRNGTEAVASAERACEITRREQPLFLGTLAAAYAEAGEFEKAVRTAREARDLARRLGQDALAARNEQLLAVYQSGHPWREPN